MHTKSIIFQHLKVFPILFAAALFEVPAICWAQLPKPSLPDPITYLNRREIVMRASRAVLEQMGYRVELEDQKGGRMVTRPYEFITGALSSSEIDKVAVKSDTITGSWLRANYTLEAVFEVVSPTETLVTVRAQFQALNRDADGTEKWVPLQSLGSVEKRVLGKISLKLNGAEPQFKDNKSFWEKKPTPVPPIKKKQPAD